MSFHFILAKKTNTAFTQLSLKVISRPRFILACIIAFTLLLATQLPAIRIDSSIEGFLNPGSPALTRYERFTQEFGEDQIFFIMIEIDDLFAPGFIEQFKRFHHELENNIPYVKRVDSLINARHIYGDAGTLFINELFEADLPSEPQALDKLREHVYSSPSYQSHLISPDRKLVSIIVSIESTVSITDEHNVETHEKLNDKMCQEANDELDRIISRYQGVLSDDIQVAGNLRQKVDIGQLIQKDFAVFSILANLIVAVILFILFRRLSGVLMPMVVMMLAIVATVSMMAISNTPFQVTTAILPSFLLAVCIGDSVHLLSHFYQRLDEGLIKRQALIEALEHTTIPMFFTTITTAAALGILSTSGLALIANLGLFAATGTIFGFFYTVLMLPCLIMILPIKRRPGKTVHNKFLWFRKIASFCARLAVTQPWRISLFGVFLLAVSSYYALQLEVEQDSLSWLPKEHPTRMAFTKMQNRKWANASVDVIIDTGNDNGALDPGLLKKVDNVLNDILFWKKGEISKVNGLTSIIKEVHQALNDNDHLSYKIPDDQALIRQELLLVEMDAADDLYRFADHNFSKLRLNLMVIWSGEKDYADLANNILRRFTKEFPDEDVSLDGVFTLMALPMIEMLSTTSSSYLLVVIVISVMMILLLGGFRIGLVAMIPNLLPVSMTLALMYFIGLPMDTFSIMIGSIAVGLCVDDTVHFMHQFKRSYAIFGDPEQAILHTLNTTGQALITTTIVLTLGFLVYTQASMNNLVNFGLLTALCITLALVADFILAPALMVLLVSLKVFEPTSHQGDNIRVADIFVTPDVTGNTIKHPGNYSHKVKISDTCTDAGRIPVEEYD